MTGEMTEDPLYGGKKTQTIVVGEEVIRDHREHMMGEIIDRQNGEGNPERLRILDSRTSWTEDGWQEVGEHEKMQESRHTLQPLSLEFTTDGELSKEQLTKVERV
jgi:hypothetical protein